MDRLASRPAFRVQESSDSPLDRARQKPSRPAALGKVDGGMERPSAVRGQARLVASGIEHAHGARYHVARRFRRHSEAVFTFDGSIFSIRYDEKVIAFAAAGIPWAVSFKVRVGNLRRLPKRLMHDLAGISIWESRISIGNRTYPGILDEFDAPDPSKIQ